MFKKCIIPDIPISIHSLVKRETDTLRLHSACSRYFNPLPREEGDPEPLLVGTHYDNFNPLPREEGDLRNDQ